jgi:hypothetical protein
MNKKVLTMYWLFLAILVFSSCSLNDAPELIPVDPPDDTPLFEFYVAADMRNYLGPQEFQGALNAINNLGPGSFLLLPGDIDPPDAVAAAIGSVMGSDHLWVPVIGNHEAETGSDMVFLETCYTGLKDVLPGYEPGPVNDGGSCFSFSVGSIRIVVINQYSTGEGPASFLAGSVKDELYAWLESQLVGLVEQYLLVVGHEPAYPQPDALSGRLRHEDDSLNAFPAERDRFQALMEAEGVDAYLFGHTHNQSTLNAGSVLHIDAGHARGIADRGAPSTFLRVAEFLDRVEIMVYRSNDGMDYVLIQRIPIYP